MVLDGVDLPTPVQSGRHPFMLPYFQSLGQTVLTRWKQANFSLAAFPKIACAALGENPPADHVDLAMLTREFLLNDAQPFQGASGFGQPELIVYDDPRFYIQVLFWLEGTTDIHQHKFSGAFHVLAGSSLHSLFEFRNADPITPHLSVGEVRMQSPHLLERGTTVPIVSGGGYIHSLFHLETPSVTVVVRTHTDPGTGPQYTYLPPHVAVNPFHHDALTTRRKQLLDVLEKTEDPAYPDLVLAMLAELDCERAFFILQNGMAHLRGLGAWDACWKVFAARFPRWAPKFLATLGEIVRRDSLVAMRSMIGDVEHRFFVALLLNLSERAQILKLIGQRFKGPPLKTIERWTEELCQSTDEVAWILDAEFPLTERPVEEQPALLLAVLHQALRGGPSGARAVPGLSVTEHRRVLAALKASSFSVLL